jgi:secreted trypsin-like serine protease
MRRHPIVLIGLITTLFCALVVPSAARPLVVGGTRAAAGEFPWMVRLSVGCGGSMITPRLVLTAAHCITTPAGPSGSITVTTGVIDLADPDAVKIRSEFVYKAPEYVGYDKGNDWALIKLAEPVVLPERPTLTIAATPEHDGGVFTIMGWGADHEGGYQQRWLLKAEVPAVDDATCGTAYRDSGANFVDGAMLCAGLFGTGGVDTCQGDSGGPMVVRTAGDAYVQVGIVSWGHGCAQAQFPGVYTQVSTYAAEINKAVAELGEPLTP